MLAGALRDTLALLVRPTVLLTLLTELLCCLLPLLLLPLLLISLVVHGSIGVATGVPAAVPGGPDSVGRQRDTTHCEVGRYCLGRRR